MFVIHEIIRLIIVKMRNEMKNRSYRHDINSPKSRHVVNITNDDAYMYVLSNIWGSIHEKVKQN